MFYIMELLKRYKVVYFAVQVLLRLCLLPNSQSVIASNQSINQRLKVRHGCRIKNTQFMEESTAESLIQCVGKCKLKTGCISITWNSSTFDCMMSTTDTIFEVETAIREYEQTDGWTCATFIRYPVFTALKSTYMYTKNRYEMSFSQASDRCAELGTTLADPSDLVTAQNLGLIYCNCGWMSDGRNALLLDKYNGVCFGHYNTGPIICSFNQADAWCKMP